MNGTAASGEFSGTFVLQRFRSEGGRLLAHGVLADIPGGEAPRAVVTIPVAAISRTCETLRVDFPATDLTLHGRTVHVNEFAVHVSDAVGGSLARSVCSVAEAPDDVSALVPLLNQLLDLVGCLMRGAAGCAQST